MNTSDDIQFSGSALLTLTNAYQNSDDIRSEYMGRFTLYPYYKAGTAETSNTISIQFEANPLDTSEDSDGDYWSPYAGQYDNAAGTATEEDITYVCNQGTAGVWEACQPIDVAFCNASRFRIKVKENGVAANYGQVRFFISYNSET